MKLSMESFQVHRIEPAKRTTWEDGILFLDFEELKGLILKDEVIEEVSIEVAHPGERTRIIHVLDAVEPRVKVEGPSVCFPGLLGPARTVGVGTTHRLSGMAVLGVGLGIDAPSGFFETGVLTYSEGFIDMTGPAQQYCACGNTVNVCLCFTVRRGCSHIEFDTATRLATLKAADYLARCTIGLKPTSEEVYELSTVDTDLPRVAYINQIHSQGFLVRTLLYGAPMEGFFTPTLLHPNELLDGAVVSANYRNFFKTCTFLQQNNFVVLELFKRHGKDLNFVGQIIGRGHFDDLQMKERQGQFAAKLAGVLGAHAAVLTIEGGGNAYIDYMLTVQALEQLGIAAVPMVSELGGAEGGDQSIVFVVPEAVSIVTGGSVDYPVEVPAMDQVIGGMKMRFADGPSAFKPMDASSSFQAKHANFYCGYWQTRVSGMSATDY